MEQVKTDQRTGRSEMMGQVENPLTAQCLEVSVQKRWPSMSDRNETVFPVEAVFPLETVKGVLPKSRWRA